jgi:acyl-CoA reductase-like NAD-dependent aldehyde dehydrogenase
MESDHRYYARRAAEERRRAAHAVTPEARERHRELASLFTQKASQPLGTQESQLVSS